MKPDEPADAHGKPADAPHPVKRQSQEQEAGLQALVNQLRADFGLTEEMKDRVQREVIGPYKRGIIDNDQARSLWKKIALDCRGDRHGPRAAAKSPDQQPPETLAPGPLPKAKPQRAAGASGEPEKSKTPPSGETSAAEPATKCEREPRVPPTVPLVPPTIPMDRAGSAESPPPGRALITTTGTAAEPPAGEGQTATKREAAEKPADGAATSADGAATSADGAATSADGAATSADAEQPPAVLEPPKKKPEWKVLEPEDRTDPVPHEVCDLVERNDQWTILAASVRGKLHAHKGLWRDDAYAFGWVDDWTIIVVSDGAGSAKLSRIGARIACHESLEELKQLLAGWKLSPGKDGQLNQNELRRLRTFLVSAAAKAVTGVQREAQSRECSVKTMNATLLLMVHVPVGQHDLVGAIQVGDGAVGIYCEDGTCTLVGIADHGEYSSETRFLTTPNIEREFEQRVLFSIKRGVQCLAAMCDGVSDDFFPEDKRLVELFVGDPISGMQGKDGRTVRGVLHEVVRDPREGKALLEWLGYERRASSDDRTLVLMNRSPR